MWGGTELADPSLGHSGPKFLGQLTQVWAPALITHPSSHGGAAAAAAALLLALDPHSTQTSQAVVSSMHVVCGFE